MKRSAVLVVGLCWLLSGASLRAEEPGEAFFEAKIRPVLVEQCYGCHAAGAKALKGGLRVDTRDAMREGGDSGPAVVPGKAGESLLLDALRYDGLEMPPRGKLPDAVVADFQRWIEMGAPDPRAGEPAKPRAKIDVAAGRAHWAYRQPVRTPAPKVNDAAWPANDTDRFILAVLEADGLRPAPEAPRAVLLRRLSFDLIGLPPTPAELDAFAADDRPDAYERAVDRLLADPRFGERWGRHWLDVARFGESLTLRGMVLKPAWRYRDYVIETFNADRPFGQFVREQVAGDLLPGEGLADRRRQIVATSFLAIGNTNLEEQDKRQLVMDVVDEQLDVIGKAFLAQTLSCARCHDHKFDPIPQADYYALAGILRNTKTLEHANVSNWIEKPLPLEPEAEARWREVDKAVAAVQSKIKKAGGDKAAVAKLQAELKGLKAEQQKRDAAITVVEEPKITDAPIHIRGSVHTLGAVVPRGFLQVATYETPASMPADQSGRRELADWLASPANPLAGRVIVNRVWHWLMGAGLVRTVDNFGTTGEAPSHPALLDDLAARFWEDGGSIKSLVRRIVLSRTYRQSADNPAARRIDPENRRLGRRDRRRLDAECLRDALLAASGRLDSSMGGPSFPSTLAEDYGFRHADTRRSVYVPAFRNALPDLFEAFDFADPSLVVGARNVSTVAPQALFLRNHPFVIEESRFVAKRILSDACNLDSRLDLASRRLLGRAPSGEERRIAREFLDGAEDDAGAWALLVQALVGSVDFRYAD